VAERVIDFGIERDRHQGFLGRAALLARLDQLLVHDRSDRWVVVTGGPGMGKSAILAQWLALRAAAGTLTPHHFIRRGEYDWDDSAKLVGSLVAQIEQRFPHQHEPAEHARRSPAARLAAILTLVSVKELVPSRERLVVMIDGLDEYDPPPGTAGDPLAAFLPHALPAGVSFLCASRPHHPYLPMLKARHGAQVWIDLDAPDVAADNAATVRSFWDRAAPPLGLDPAFITQAVERAAGNLQHAVMLQKHLEGVPALQRQVEILPDGLEALLEKSWERIAVDPVAVVGLGILCAAREALTLDELGAVAGWTTPQQRSAFVHGARELLVESRRADNQRAYRLHHESIRAQIASALGPTAVRCHHAALARQFATWPPAGDPETRKYCLRYALTHRVEAGDWQSAWRLAADMLFLEVKCRELGAHDTEIDVSRAAERCQAGGGTAVAERFSDLARAIARESHQLRVEAGAAPALLWNRLRRLGWSIEQLEGQLTVPPEAAFLRVRHATSRESSALVRDLVDHAGSVNACAVTPDGRLLVSGSWDRTIKLWDLNSGRVLLTLGGHPQAVNACAVTSDGRRLVSASDDATLKLWDLVDGSILATLEGHAGAVRACAMTPDGRRVVSASDDRTVKLWDLETGRVVATLESHTGPVRTCAVTPDGRYAVSGSLDRTLKVWELDTVRLVATLKGHTGAVHTCAVTPDGRRVVSGSFDRTLKLWDLGTCRILATLEAHTSTVTACAVMPDGRRVISASGDRTLHLWDLDTGRVLASLAGHARSVTACAVAPDGRWVVTASEDHTLKLWDIDRVRGSAARDGHAGIVTACVVTPDGRHVVTASEDKTLKLWDPDAGLVRASLEGHIHKVRTCAVSPDGRRLISASDDAMIKIWDLDTGDARATFQGPTGGVRACAMTPDGRRAVLASIDPTLELWDLEAGQRLATLEGHTEGVSACAVTRDGRWLVSASWDRTLKLWDLDSGRLCVTFEGHIYGVTACAVTRDGRWLISASWDQTLKVWELRSGRVLATLEGHTGWVNACAVTPDGRYLVSASHDQTLRLWDLDTHACLVTHRGDTRFTSVAAKDSAIVAGDAAGTVWFLDLPTIRSTRSHRRSGRDESQFGTTPAHGTEDPRPPVSKHTILFLAANPPGTDRRALDQEAHAIQHELERTGHRDKFELVTRWAVQPLDLLRELRKLRPTVVHFSGHVGVDDADFTDSPARHGLYFQGSDGRPQLVSSAALEQAFGAAGLSVKLVVLNACYSDVQAEALLAHVDCVVGMGGSISDHSVRSFAIGFYGGLGERESVAAAFKQGCAAIGLEALRDSDRPQLRIRDGVDADRLILAVDLPAIATAASATEPSVGSINAAGGGVLVVGTNLGTIKL
jgi:WD40 repeat protein